MDFYRKRHIGLLLKHLAWIASCVVLLSCSSEEDDDFGDVGEKTRITVLSSLGGQGDNGYNDLITEGIMKMSNNQDVELSMVHPCNMDEAVDIFRVWQQTPIEGRSLLLLVGDYENFVDENMPPLDDNKQIILFETKSKNLPRGVMGFRIQRYGVSYLAGCIASPHRGAVVIAAMPGATSTEDAIRGFTEGYAIQGRQAEVSYLAQDESGYAMPDSAYRWASSMDELFVYPLAGGSNNGIYKSSRDMLFSTMLVAGMDVDCSAFSGRIPFSVVIHIDRIIEQYMTDWIAGKDIPTYRSFGMESGMVEVVLSTLFYKLGYIFEDYYRDTEYWQKAKDQYYEKALRKEKEYENN